MRHTLAVVALTAVVLLALGGATAYLADRLAAVEGRIAEASADAAERDRELGHLALIADAQAASLKRQTAALEAAKTTLDAQTAELAAARKRQEAAEAKLAQLEKAVATPPKSADGEKLAKLVTELESLNGMFRDVLKFVRGQ